MRTFFHGFKQKLKEAVKSSWHNTFCWKLFSFQIRGKTQIVKDLPMISVQSVSGNLSNGSKLLCPGSACGTKTTDFEQILSRPLEKLPSAFAGLFWSRINITATSVK